MDVSHMTDTGSDVSHLQQDFYIFADHEDKCESQKL